MRTFDSRHYKVLGFMKVSVDGQEAEYWLLQTVDRFARPNFTTETIMVKEAKYVDHGYVYYLHEQGRVENKLREKCVLPAY